MAAIEYVYEMSDLAVLEDNFASLKRIDGTNIRKVVAAFDESTAEYRNGKFLVPGDIDTSGTVTFTCWGMAATAAASKNVALRFEHSAIADGEAYDAAYTAENSGDIAVNATQDYLTKFEWTETVTNLAWAADDTVYFRVSRQAASANELSGDLYLEFLRINIPTS